MFGSMYIVHMICAHLLKQSKAGLNLCCCSDPPVQFLLYPEQNLMCMHGGDPKPTRMFDLCHLQL